MERGLLFPIARIHWPPSTVRRERRDLLRSPPVPRCSRPPSGLLCCARPSRAGEACTYCNSHKQNVFMTLPVAHYRTPSTATRVDGVSFDRGGEVAFKPQRAARANTARTHFGTISGLPCRFAPNRSTFGPIGTLRNWPETPSYLRPGA